MHLLERYALATGSKIGKPTIVKKFFPVDADKYITLQNSSGMPGKCYDYFQDVVSFLLPKLIANGYKIVQIGGSEDTPIEGCLPLQGKTTINQTAYVLSNSSLHLGNDSFAVHMASAFNVPTVALYSITLPEIAGPYWYNKKINLIPSPDHKPSFNPNESPKTINSIKIEDVVAAVNSLLFESDDLKIKTLYMGNRYKDRVIETTADQIIDPNFFKDEMLNIRLDYCAELTEAVFNSMLQNVFRRKCSIVTDKSFNCTPFVQFKQNLTMVIYEVTERVDIAFIEQLEKFGFTYVCVFDTGTQSADVLEKRKFELMEHCGVQAFTKKIQNPPELPTGSKFKTNRILLSNQKAYNSRACQLEDIPVVSSSEFIGVDKIKNKDTLLEDLEFCLVVQ